MPNSTRIICRIAKGKRYFHTPDIDWSRRSRAKMALKKEISNTTIIVLTRKIKIAGIKRKSCIPPRYKVAINAEAKTTSRFLPSFIIASFLPLNSVRHPATTSDSDSGMLKGAVSSSAINAINNIAKPIG